MKTYEFGDYRLDAESRKLFRQTGEVLPLTPRVFDLLLALIENNKRVLTKDELLETVWADCVVEESNLSQSVFVLRKALGETSKNARFIRTVPAQGYRFIAPVKIENGNGFGEIAIPDNVETLVLEKEETKENRIDETQIILPKNRNLSAVPQRRGKIKSATLVAALTASALILLLLIGWSYFQKSPKPIDSIAVLPFTNAGGESNLDYLTDGLTENVTNKLARLPRLKVLARSVVSKYKGKEIDPLKVGSELGVGAILVGTLAQESDTLNVRLELIETASGNLLWGESYKRKSSDLLGLQEEIARRTTEKLNLKLTAEEQRQFTKRHTENAEAFQFYLRGRHHLNKRSFQDLPKAVEFFSQAVSTDAKFSTAYSGLATAYALYGTYGIAAPKDSMPKARQAAETALSLDENSDEAHTVLAAIAYSFDYNWAEAEKRFQRALEINPNSVSAHHWYGEFLTVVGRFDEGLAHLETASKLDPLSHVILMQMSLGWYLARRYDEAVNYSNRALNIEKNFATARYNLSEFHEQQGKWTEAAAEWQKAMLMEETAPIRVLVLEKAFIKNGYHGFVQAKVAWLEELRSQFYILPTDLAKGYAALGDKNKALEWLEKGFEERTPDMIFIKRSPAYDNLRTEPRFQLILEKMNFAE